MCRVKETRVPEDGVRIHLVPGGSTFSTSVDYHPASICLKQPSLRKVLFGRGGEIIVSIHAKCFHLLSLKSLSSTQGSLINPKKTTWE